MEFCRAVIGELDEDVDARLDMQSLKAEQLSAIVHWLSKLQFN